MGVFEREVLESVAQWTEIYSYRVYIGRITELEQKFASFTKVYQDIIFEESRLLGFKANHDVYEDLRDLVEPHLNFWSSVSSVLTSKRTWFDTKLKDLRYKDLLGVTSKAGEVILRVACDQGFMSRNKKQQDKIVKQFEHELTELRSYLELVGALGKKKTVTEK